MIGLVNALADLEKAVGIGDQENITWEKANTIIEARCQMETSHISITHDDGNYERRDVTWCPSRQRFVDHSNSFWLYGPDSPEGNGSWIIGISDDNPGMRALSDSAVSASKSKRTQRLWQIYWQMIFFDYMITCSTGTTIDLHIKPLDITALGKVPV